MFWHTIISTVFVMHLVILLIVNGASVSNSFSSAKENIETVSSALEVFHKKATTLNCFGIPSILFADIVEKLFTQTTKAEDVRFYFYSRDQIKNVTIYANDKINLSEINYKINRETIIIVHGFMSSGQETWVTNMKDALLKLDDYNIIIVDWQSGSNTWNYYSASISTKIVGFQIAKLITELGLQILQKVPVLKELGSLHFIGHSLGSHICGRAANLLQKSHLNKKSQWILKRITGLDPAQPCFSTADLSLKLDNGDAEFVDVVHTNARHILFLGLGLPDQLGHMDFYPNGGQIQLGCAAITTAFWGFLPLPQNIIRTAICSHGRSYELFTDSIHVKISKNCTFIGHKWNRTYTDMRPLLKKHCKEPICPELGINSINYHLRTNGTFFVPTTDSPPYCHINKNVRLAIKEQLKQDKEVNNNIFVEFMDMIG